MPIENKLILNSPHVNRDLYHLQTVVNSFLEHLPACDITLWLIKQDNQHFISHSAIKKSVARAYDILAEDSLVLNIFTKIIANLNINIGSVLDSFIKKISFTNTLSDDGALDVGDMGNLTGKCLSPELHYLLSVVLAKRLHQIIYMREHGDHQIHPQNLRHILSYFSQEQQPPFVLIAGSLMTIVADNELYAIEERHRAARILINRYPVEVLFILVALEKDLSREKKEHAFTVLGAFHKYYDCIEHLVGNRKILKTEIANTWFSNSFSEFVPPDQIPKADSNIASTLKKLIDSAEKGHTQESYNCIKALLLIVDKEDLIRYVNSAFLQSADLRDDVQFQKILYKAVYNVIREYRELASEQENLHMGMKKTFTIISSAYLESESLFSDDHAHADLIAFSSTRKKYTLLPETKKFLKESNLQHMFEIWPIPTRSQQIFNMICKLLHDVPQDRSHKIFHYLYREKMLEFFMRLEKCEIKVVKDDSLPLLTNAFQLHTHHKINKGLYLGTTGHWLNHHKKPPSVISCSAPNAIGNCMGYPLRHVFLRVFLATGQFYESPFVIDSTQRYGQLDEEDASNLLYMRPGLFLLDIPEKIQKHWFSIQQKQTQQRLRRLIEEKIRIENKNR